MSVPIVSTILDAVTVTSAAGESNYAKLKLENGALVSLELTITAGVTPPTGPALKVQYFCSAFAGDTGPDVSTPVLGAALFAQQSPGEINTLDLLLHGDQALAASQVRQQRTSHFLAAGDWLVVRVMQPQALGQSVTVTLKAVEV